MTSSVQSQLTQMQTATNVAEAAKKKTEGTTDVTDSNMFLKLMLQQLQYQDPTEPVSNEQWLAQLSQYSSLEQMTNLNTNFESVATNLTTLSDMMTTNNAINQTLSLVGKEVTLTNPENENEKITGVVSEASFDEGSGMVKVNGKNYSIAYIESVREAQ